MNFEKAHCCSCEASVATFALSSGSVIAFDSFIVASSPTFITGIGRASEPGISAPASRSSDF